MNLFSTLFETFDNISKHDINQGTVNGIKSLYAMPATNIVGMTIDSLNNHSKTLKQKISNLHRSLQFNMNISAKGNLSGFNEFTERLEHSMELNNIFTDDKVIQKKLAEFLTYCYISASKDASYLIYDDINAAKKVSRIVFIRAKKSGLTFMSPDMEDIIKTILFTVFYKLPKE